MLFWNVTNVKWIDNEWDFEQNLKLMKCYKYYLKYKQHRIHEIELKGLVEAWEKGSKV